MIIPGKGEPVVRSDRLKHRTLIVALGLVLVLALVFVLARSAAAQWQDQLTHQIAWAEDCEVAFLSHVIEREIDGRDVVMVKVHCTDKRDFDALREDKNKPFQFTACEPRHVESC